MFSLYFNLSGPWSLIIVSGWGVTELRKLKIQKMVNFFRNMNEAMMSLPASLTVASHQRQTGQHRVVYPAVKNKMPVSFFFFFLFCSSNLHLLLQTEKTSATSDSGPPNSPEIQNSKISASFKVEKKQVTSPKDSTGTSDSSFKASSAQT